MSKTTSKRKEVSENTLNKTHVTLDEGGLPLLDEVNELLEKEKLLMNLKLLEQKQAAEEWKAKYDKLVDHMMDSAISTNDFGVLEVAADTESTIHREQIPIVDEDGKDVIESLKPYKMINLSSKHITNSELTKISRDIIMAKGTRNPTHIFLNHCDLTDSNVSAINSLIKVPSVDAIDLSYNNLGHEFEDTLVEILKVRRKTPQYLLLNGNMKASLSSNFSDVLHLLTERSWGLTISLQDMAIANSKGDKNSKSKLSGPKVAGPKIDFIGLAKRTMCAQTFLKEFNSALNIDNNDDRSKSSSNKKSTKAIKPKSGTGSGRLRPSDKREGGLQLISVFGLTDAQLSSESIELLNKTLDLTKASLTDLDLRRCYLGANGATLIKEALERTDCNLIRLCLAGNALGDTGISKIASGLKTNSTLTHLDVSSNDITRKGLNILCDTIVTSKVLHTLDLRSNNLNRYDISVIEKTLLDHGNPINLKWQSVTTFSNNKTYNENSYLPKGKIIFSNPEVASVILSDRSSSACIHSADARTLLKASSGSSNNNRNSADVDDDRKSYLIRWYTRLSAPSTGSKYNILDVSDIAWEAHLVSSTEEFIKDNGRIDKRCKVPAYVSSSESLRCGKWIEHRALIHNPPRNCSIELWFNNTSLDKTSVSKVNVEVHSFTIQEIIASNGDRMMITADYDEWSPTLNTHSSCSLALDGTPTQDNYILLSSLPEDHTLSRVFTWNTFTVDTAEMKFQVKLFAQNTIDTSNGDSKIAPLPSATTSRDGPSDGFHVGYICTIIILQPNGSYNIIDEIKCDSVNSRSEGSALTPWLWKDWCVNLPLLMPNDRILLSVLPTIDSSARNKKRCSVQVQNCQISIEMDPLLENKNSTNDFFSGAVMSLQANQAIHDYSELEICV